MSSSSYFYMAAVVFPSALEPVVDYKSLSSRFNDCDDILALTCFLFSPSALLLARLACD